MARSHLTTQLIPQVSEVTFSGLTQIVSIQMMMETTTTEYQITSVG